MNEGLNMETYETVSGNMSPGAGGPESGAGESLYEQQYIQNKSSIDAGAGDIYSDMSLMEDLGQLVDSLNSNSLYGTLGDYYNPQLGFTVLPGADVYQYFYDAGVVSGEWSETSDGHFVEASFLEAYEAASASDEGAPEPTETELQNVETLESINGTLAAIKQNQAVYYENVYAYQTETLANQEEMLAWEEIQTYCGIGTGILTGVIAGCLFAESIFGKMRLG